MVNPAIVTAGINAGASILGSVFGDKGPSQKELNNHARVQNNVLTRDANIARIQGAVQGAKKYGIHPLVALNGSSTSHGGSMPIADQTKQSSGVIEAAGQGISRSVEALMTEKARLENKLLKTQVSGQEIDNMKNASELALTTQGAPPAPMSALPSESIAHVKGDEGLEGAHTPMYKKFKIGNKGHIYGLSEAASETIEGYGHIGGTALGLAALAGTAPKYLRDWKKWHKKRMNNPRTRYNVWKNKIKSKFGR